MINRKTLSGNARARALTSSSVLAVALVLGCGEQGDESTEGESPAGALVCFLGWSGELAYDGPSLEAQTCWNSKCSGTLTATVMPLAFPSPASIPEETPQVSPDEDISEECERSPVEGAQTPPPCGGPVEVDPNAIDFPLSLDPGCGVDEQVSDFPVQACASTRTDNPGSTTVQIWIWPKQHTPGQGQDLLRDGDQLSLRLEGTDGVLVDETVTIDQYDAFSEGGSSCRSAGFDLDGNRQ